jgi:hypothetical protein
MPSVHHPREQEREAKQQWDYGNGSELRILEAKRKQCTHIYSYSMCDVSLPARKLT